MALRVNPVLRDDMLNAKKVVACLVTNRQTISPGAPGKYNISALSSFLAALLLKRCEDQRKS